MWLSSSDFHQVEGGVLVLVRMPNPPALHRWLPWCPCCCWPHALHPRFAGQDSQRGKALREMGAPWRLLLTGTPLQVGGQAAVQRRRQSSMPAG